MKRVCLAFISAVLFSACSYVIAESGYVVKGKEYRVDKKAGRIQKRIVRREGIKTALDNAFESGNVDSMNRYVGILDSCFEKYPFRDTIGSQRRFERALRPQLRQAVARYSDCVQPPNKIIVRLFEENDKVYLSLGQTVTLRPYADGYLLYGNKILIGVYYSDFEHSDRLLHRCRLEALPYTMFLPVGSYAEGGSHYSLDYYEVIGRDSIRFLGRGFWGEGGVVQPR